MIDLDKLTIAVLMLLSFTEAVIIPVLKSEYTSFNAFWLIIFILTIVLTIKQYQDADN